MAAQAKLFFEATEGHCLKAWMRWFDINHDGKVDFNEFCLGMKSLNYQGDISALWYEMDEDRSNELTLNEICEESAQLWVAFTMWCAGRFESAEDMVNRLGDGRGISLQPFQQKVARYGWSDGQEELIFLCMDTKDDGSIGPDNLRWLDKVKKKQRRKEKAKAHAAAAREKKQKEMQRLSSVLKDFKAFLIKRHGCLFRAWRKELDDDGSMTVQRKELFKACRESGWKGDVRVLWKALDRDDSGMTSLEELDTNLAWELAQFKVFLDSTFGNAAAAFKAFDKSGTRKIRLNEFCSAAVRHGFQGDRAKLRKIFGLIDWQGARYLTETGMLFMDAWRPPVWLTSPGANNAAAEAMKAQLTRRYKRLLKAWRLAMDGDGSNRVSWQEFEECAKKVGFRGDVAGAWLAFDTDLSGFITYKEIDPEGYDIIASWKAWAEEEFGSIHSAFKVLDADGSGSLSFVEFRRACRYFGFLKPAKPLFSVLDCDGAGSLSLNEVSYLDEWESQQSEADSLEPNQAEEESGNRDGGIKSGAPVMIADVAAVASWFRLRRQARTPHYIATLPCMDDVLPSTIELSVCSSGQQHSGRKLHGICMQTGDKGATNEHDWPKLSSPYAMSLPVPKWVKEKNRRPACATATGSGFMTTKSSPRTLRPVRFRNHR